MQKRMWVVVPVAVLLVAVSLSPADAEDSANDKTKTGGLIDLPRQDPNSTARAQSAPSGSARPATEGRPCDTDAQCSDGIKCNGREVCDRPNPNYPGRCKGVMPPCDGYRPLCLEASGQCFRCPAGVTNIDQDGDGYARAECQTSSGGNYDCDDQNASVRGFVNRCIEGSPGTLEYCRNGRWQRVACGDGRSCAVARGQAECYSRPASAQQPAAPVKK